MKNPYLENRSDRPGGRPQGLSLRPIFLFLGLLLLALWPQTGATTGTLLDTPGDLVWSAPLNLSQNSGRSTYPYVAAVTTTQDLWVVWVDYTDHWGEGEVLARQRLGSTGVWTGTINLSNYPDDDSGAAMVADAQGRVHLAWTRRSETQGSDLLYRQWTAADGWSPTVVLDHTYVYHPFPYGLFFTTDLSGTVHLFLTRSLGEVNHTRLGAGGWEPLPAWVYLSGIRTLGTIVAGPDGLFHAIAFGENEVGSGGGCDSWLSDGYYLTTDGQQWGSPVNLTSIGTMAFDVALSYDGAGALHFLWSDIRPYCAVDCEKSAVYERVLADGSWSARSEVTIPNEGQAVEDLVLLSDPQGRLHLAWSEGLFDASGQAALNLAIRYRRWMAGAWGPEEIVFGSEVANVDVDMALNQAGEPALAWENGPADAREVFFSERGFRCYIPLLVRGPFR